MFRYAEVDQACHEEWVFDRESIKNDISRKWKEKGKIEIDTLYPFPTYYYPSGEKKARKSRFSLEKTISLHREQRPIESNVSVME